MYNEKEFNKLQTQLYYEAPNKYFDFASTTPVYNNVIDTIMEQLKTNFGNPSSLTCKGIEAKNAISEASQKITKTLNSFNYNLYFTSGATESNNWVASMLHEGDNVIITGFEHPSVANAFKKTGARLIYFNPNASGEFDMELLKSLVDTYNPKLVSVMGVNNETGLIIPTYEIARICKGKTLLHCDLTQAIPHCIINCDRYGCDFYSFSGHKFGAPKGIGGFLVKKTAEKFLDSFIVGGHQQMSHRAGTENVAYIVGMAEALTTTCSLIKSYNAVIDAYQKFFIENLKKRLTKTQTECIIINERANDNTFFIPSIINVCFKNINGYTLMKMLDLKDIVVSTGSACSADYDYVSPTLKVLGVPEDYIHGSIRISLGFGTTKNDLEYLIEEIITAISQLERLK